MTTRMADATCPFRCGQLVYCITDKRFVGEVIAHTATGNVVIRWPNGFRSYVPTHKVRAAPEWMKDNR